MASRVLNAESRFPSRVQIKTRTNRQPILPLNLSLVLCRISQPAGRPSVDGCWPRLPRVHDTLLSYPLVFIHKII